MTGETTPGDPGRANSERDATVTRHEEELVARTSADEAGSVRVRKHVDTYPVERVMERHIERAEMADRVGPNENDSGEIETLPDGSISIPVLEEELVVTKRLVVRERVIVRKATVTDAQRINAQLKKERVEVVTDPGVEDVVETASLEQAPSAISSPRPRGHNERGGS